MSKVKLIGKGSGNDASNPNGMNLYWYRGKKIPAYRAADVPMRYRYLYGR